MAPPYYSQHAAFASLWALFKFILYIAELADIAASWNVNLYSCADDTQVLLHCEPRVVCSAVLLLQQCIDDIGQWMAANCLKLNPDKMEFL